MPKRTTRQTDSQIVQSFTDKTVRGASQLLDIATPSHSTIRRRLTEGGIEPRVTRPVEIKRTDPRVMAARAQWVAHWVEEWAGWTDRTVWIDESCIQSCTVHRAWRYVPKVTKGRVPLSISRCDRTSIRVFEGLCGI